MNAFWEPDDARRLAVVAAELRPLAAAIAALADVEWHSPAADAYRRLVTDIADDTEHLASRLYGTATSVP